MTESRRGLYEVLITDALAQGLRDLDTRLEVRSEKLRAAEAADRIALHLGRLVERAIAGVPDNERVDRGVTLARELIEHIEKTIADAEVGPESPIRPAAMLRAIVGRLPDGSPETIPPPLIPLLDTTLLTNAPGEPRVGSQLLTEVVRRTASTS